MTTRLPARLRIPLTATGLVATVLGLVIDSSPLAFAGAALLAVGLLLYFRVGTVRARPVPIRPPVRGRWSALNSPADKVPSHGLHAYGQTYAMDLVHGADLSDHEPLRWWPPTQPCDRFTGFGQPILAPVDGTVVHVENGQRDHRARMSWPGLALFFAEGTVRELAGPRRLLGNHVVIEMDDGDFALVAHLRRGSVAVRPGDRVTAGQPIGECGNSGSSTMPHVHFQVMDRPQIALAAGLPFTLTGATDAEGRPLALPAGRQAIHA